MAAKLGKKQDAFVKAYLLNGGNATQAAIDAGYSKSTARQMGAENLTKPVIKAEIEKHQKKADADFIWSKQEKLKKLQEITDKSMRGVFDQYGNERMENPQAAVSAIKEHNLMQGDNAPTESKETPEPLQINFNVSTPKDEIEITRGES